MDGGDHLYGIQEALGELCNRLSNAADEGYFFEVKFVKVKIRGYEFIGGEVKQRGSVEKVTTYPESEDFS
jgi:hypothetical protein